MKLIFIAKDSISKHTWEPVISAAIIRGHEVILTTDINTEGDIGFYCDDKSTPGAQKLKVISINGLDQDHVIRPNYAKFFVEENWGDFDLGILPGKRWFEGMKIAAQVAPYCAPRLGVIEAGWPKSDIVFTKGDPLILRRQKKNPKVILYAPQTEQDFKQTEVVEALLGTDYELWVKHWETKAQQKICPEFLTDAYMQNLANENSWAQQKIYAFRLFSPEENFMKIIIGADLLITDQSSVLYEAALCGIPTLTVRDWKHACGNCQGPQPSPDITVVSESGKLRESIEEILSNYPLYVNKTEAIREDNFVNLGNAANILLNKVEEVFSEKL